MRKKQSNKTTIYRYRFIRIVLLENDQQAYQLVEPFPYLATEHIVDFMHMSFAKNKYNAELSGFIGLKKYGIILTFASYD